MATITGKKPTINRVVTGFHSFDRAFVDDLGNIGIPVGVGYELFGVTGVGKSTFAWSLAGLLGKELEKNIALADLEGFDSLALKRVLEWSQFTGECRIIEDVRDGKRKEKSMDENMLDNLIHCMYDDEYSIGIVDSVAAISPIAEQEGTIGEANMGRRAKIVAQFCRKALPLIRVENSNKTFFLVNHWYPRIGSQGYNTPAGEVMKYLTTVRVLLKRKEKFPDGSYVIEGLVHKNRWGFERRAFYVFMLVGRGLHRGLSCMYDAVIAGKAARHKYIKVGDATVGTLAELVKAAKSGEEDKFAPFYGVLDDRTEDFDSDDVSDIAADEMPEDTI